MISTAKKQQEAPSVLLRNLGGMKKTRRIIDSGKLSKQDRDGIVKLYEALVPKKGIEVIDIEAMKKHFPTFDDIDVDMIAEEAFPAFERTIGVENFAKLKRYFGIGVKPSRFGTKAKDIEMFIAKLRTIENAQYYMSGYKDLISKTAPKLEGAPEGLTELEKAKIVRLYVVIICGFFYFAEDYSYSNYAKKEVCVDYEKVQKNNKMEFLPEEFFRLYASKIHSIPDNNLFYEHVYSEITALEKRTLKEVLSFAELDLGDDGFFSSNVANVNQTYGSIRNIKIKVHHEPGCFPIEVFGLKCMAEKVDLGDLYLIYKVLKTMEMEEFPKEDKPFVKLEGSRIIKSTHTCYEIIKGMFVAGPVEMSRFVNLMELVSAKGLDMQLKTDESGNELEVPKNFNAKKFMSAVMFANELAYLDAGTAISKDFEVAEMLIGMDKDDALERFYSGEITTEGLKEEFGIDADFEYENFGIRKQVSHSEIAKKFAVDCGYVGSKTDISEELMDAVFISGNEELIEDYEDGIITREKFEKKIGFTNEFAEMFFVLSKVDMTAIEAKLLETKRATATGQKKIDHHLKMLVDLYCYLVENEIACGPKNRVPKRNKSLKPSNLRSFVA